MTGKTRLAVLLITITLLAAACTAAGQALTAPAASAQAAPLAPQDTFTYSTVKGNASVQQTIELSAPATELAEPEPALAAEVRQEDTPLLDAAVDIMRTGTVIVPTTAHALPDTDAEVFGQLEAGTTVVVTRAYEGWYELILIDDGSRHAWVQQATVSLQRSQDWKSSAWESTQEASPVVQPDNSASESPANGEESTRTPTALPAQPTSLHWRARSSSRPVAAVPSISSTRPAASCAILPTAWTRRFRLTAARLPSPAGRNSAGSLSSIAMAPGSGWSPPVT